MLLLLTVDDVVDVPAGLPTLVWGVQRAVDSKLTVVVALLA
jgi:hypothetical protein